LPPTTPSARVSRAIHMLPSLTLERWEHLIATSSRWSDSTLRKHAWARLIWTAFCDNLKLKPFPLDANKHHLGAFMEWLVMTVGYALTSAKDVIVASLYRIHTEETGGEQVPQKIRDTVNLAAKKCKQRAPSCTRSGRMRDACLKDDVIQIITMIPDGKRKKARDASCWLHSVSTGARAITASNILLGHFQNFIIQNPSDPHSLCFFSLLHQVTKGKPGDWNHMITLEGYIRPPPHINPTGDFIYWLNLHLQETHSLSLEEFSTWNLSSQQQASSLWGLSPDALNARLRKCATLANYPSGLFTFHSLRAGFLCTALIKQGLNDSQQRNAVLESTAFIAGWQPYGRSQQRYVKSTAIKSMVANRLVSSSGESSTSLMDPTLVTKESLQTNYEAFYDKVMERFQSRTDLSKSDHAKLCKSLWQKCFHAWIDNHEDEVEEEMSQEMEAFKQRNNSQDASPPPPPLNHIKTIVGRRHIASLLAGNFQLLDELLEAFIEPALPHLQNHSPLKQVPYKKRKNGPFQLQTSTPRTRIKTSNHRQRQPWSDEETKELIHLRLHKKATWVEIASTLPQQLRTNVDCKDKWRNLMLKFKQRQDLSSFQNQKLCNALWYCCSNDWVRTHEEELQEELQKEARDYELRNEGPVRWNNVNKIVARRHIASLLSGNYDLLKELVDEFTAPVDKTLEEGSPIKQVAAR
ncbi:hypothetical protein QOT17_025379, partial [Balamuthia mandrillaris]